MILQEKWIDEYLIDCNKRKQLSHHSLKAYKIDLNLFKEKMCDYGMNLNKESLKAYVLFLNDIYMPKSAKRKLASIKAFIRYLMFEELINSNPLDKVRTTFNVPKTIPRTIAVESITQINQLIQIDYQNSKTTYQKILHLRNLIVVDFFISTGIRVSELCSIKCSNLNYYNKTILIEGKGQKERLVYIGEESTWDLIREYQSQRQELNSGTEYLFLSMNGNQIDSNSIRHLLKKYCKRANFDKHVTPHQFRHTFATLLLEDDVDIRIIQKILGHSSISTTAIYADVAQEKIRQVMISKNPKHKV